MKKCVDRKEFRAVHVSGSLPNGNASKVGKNALPATSTPSAASAPS